MEGFHGFPNGKSFGNMDDLGVFPFQETSTWWNYVFFWGKRLTNENCG